MSHLFRSALPGALRASYRARLVLLPALLALCSLLALGLFQHHRRTPHRRTPSSAPTAARQAHQVAVTGANRALYAFQSTGDQAAKGAKKGTKPSIQQGAARSYSARNPRHDFTARFDARGVQVKTRHGDALRLQWQSVERAGTKTSVAPAHLAQSGGVLHLRRAGVTEWFKNSSAGLEQGFTLQKRPGGKGDEVRLTLAASGLRAKTVQGHINFVDAKGKTALSYSHLKVWDASGKTLPARMEAKDVRILLALSDKGARYPVTIDPTISSGSVLWSDDFDADHTAQWTVNNNNIGTNAATFFFDYSTVGIPAAPNSSGTTRGLKLGANLNAATAPATGSLPGISVSPTGQSFTGDYKVTFDWWSNYIGPLNVGATGSTMLSNFGILTSGTTPNYPAAIDSVMFGATGDGQSASDYRIFSPERPTAYDIFPASGNPLDAHATYAAGSRNSSAALYMSTFPAGATAPGSQASMPTQTNSTPAGAAGFRWHEVVIEKTGATVTWTVNDVLLATLDTTLSATPTGGANILFGMSDTNNTTNSNASLMDQLQFTLIDNVVVEASAPPPYVVNSTADTTDGACTAVGTGDGCTLRDAIGLAEGDGTSSDIHFNIPTSDAGYNGTTGVFTINLGSALPTITQPVTIDGYTQPGASANTQATGSNAVLKIELTSAGLNGLTITGTNSTVQGLAIGNCNFGIWLSGATGNAISGNYLGVHADGTTAFNNNYGVVLQNGAATNTVGGSSAAARNVLSSNNNSGVYIQGDSATAQNNTVEGNTIGTNAAGTAALGNVYGVFLTGAVSNTIGGTAAGAGNLVSGNDQGIHVENGATGNLVQGNTVGLNAAGTAALGNNYGVLLYSGGNTVGGTASGARNVISANNNSGVYIHGDGATAQNNTVEGNYIGTNAAGTAALGNVYGFYLTGAVSNTIGGTSAGAGNLVSGNNHGININGGATGNLVQGNTVGLNAAGTATLANQYGVVLDGASNNTIGGTANGADNVITGSIYDGVTAFNGGTGDAVRGNSIYANGDLGIDLGNDGVTLNDDGDGDADSNNSQNFPVITSSTSSGGNTVVVGTLNSTADTAFTLDFYASDAADPSGHGEGQTYLGSDTGTTVGNNGSFTATLTGVTLAAGQFVTATATDSAGNTSEFSLAVAATIVTQTYEVNSIADDDDGACAALPSSDCTLREAIGLANTDGEVSAISFNIPGGGVHTINLGSTLTLSAAYTTIDGYTQTGASANTLATGSDAVLKIELVGSGGGFDGLTISGANHTVQGLSIGNCNRGIYLNGAGAAGNVLRGNFIGTQADGATARANTRGIELNNAAGNTIGGTAAAARNVLSGNSDTGMTLNSGASGNTLVGNYIGTNAAGTAALANGSHGVEIGNGANNVIGGSASGAGNVISGNLDVGVYCHGAGTTGNTVQGNKIGTNAAGSAALANKYGVVLVAADNHTIGGTNAGEGNLISGNTNAGVVVLNPATGNRVRGNSISANGGLGIDFSDDGVTANDAGDGDTGPNNLQNFPVLASATSGGGNTVVAGTLNSTANTTFTLDFYASDAADPSGNGEGQIYLGSDTVTTDGSGDVNINATLAGANVASGQFVTATATDPNGNTSEFSNAVAGVRLVQNYEVNSAADTDDGACDALTTGTGNQDCTLREAVTLGNTDGKDSNITFNIPGGVQTIALGATLPLTEGGTTIDGYTQPGASANTLATGSNAVLLIELNGNGNHGLTITGTGCTVKGLSIGNCNFGIWLSGATGNVMAGNYVGLHADGTTAFNNNYGVVLQNGAATNTVGGTGAGARNVISGNNQTGVYNDGPGNTIAGNYIGTDVTGTVALGNGTQGINVESGSNTTIGGTASGAGNLISGNASFGIRIANGTGDLVQGNKIGTNAAGTVALANQYGVVIYSGGNTVGGSASGAGNLISGNANVGVYTENATGNTIAGNKIGTNAAGTAALANGSFGIQINGGSTNTIGGTAGGAGNLVSGNDQGIRIEGVGTGNLVRGNTVGLDAAGTAALGNNYGVLLYNGGNTVGGTASGARNVISGNNNSGVYIQGDGATAQNNTVEGNYIGTNAAGSAALGNLYGVSLINAVSNTIGGISGGAGNLISGNSSGHGINLNSGSTGTLVQGNTVGLNAAGTATLANQYGVLLSGVSNNTIGGTGAGAGNVITGSTNAGVLVFNGGTGNAVRGNSIYANGDLGIDLENDGVTGNDDGDGDGGTNNRQNFPVITSVTSAAGDTVIAGTLNSTADTTFQVDFFDNASADSSGYGEGQTYLGSTTAIIPPGANDVAFSKTVTGFVPADEHFITATATDPDGNISEFSLAAVFSSSPLQSGPNFVVNVTSDDDGVCTTTNCSLHEAVKAANGNADTSSITFDAAVFNAPKTITLGGSELLITTSTTITGPAARVTVDGNNASRVFTVNGGTSSISALTITGGNGVGSFPNPAGGSDGGGILLKSGSLTLLGCAIVNNNTADSKSAGGGIASVSLGTLTVTNCVISNNTSNGLGGGIGNYGDGGLNITGSTIANNTTTYAHSYLSGGVENYGTLAMTNCTISGNHADNATGGNNAGGILNFGPATTTNCTITGNTAAETNSAGGVRCDSGGTLTVSNTIIAGNTGTSGATADVNNTSGGTFTTGGYNLIGDGTGATGFTDGTNGDQVGTTGAEINPRLGPLADNGGPTQTHALLDTPVVSPAIDAGDPASTLSEDQRGYIRPTDGPDAGSTATVDIGAFEFGSTPAVVQSGPDFEVNVTNDHDSACTENDCSLHEAIAAANSNSDASAITFDATVFATATTITLGAQLPTITTNTTITGPAARVTVSGNNATRILRIESGTVTLDKLTLTKGRGGGLNNGATLTMQNCTVSQSFTSDVAGGIYNGGTLTLANCQITGNTTNGSGGGIYNDSGSTLHISGSTVANNTANDDKAGGGIDNGGTLTMTNCTISGNHADNASGNNGGGIRNSSGAADAAITNSTITGNTAAGMQSAGGLRYGAGNVTVSNTIVAGNSGTNGAAADVSDVNAMGTLTSNGYNLIGDGTGSAAFTNGTNGDQVGTSASPIDAKLAGLDDNGGPTLTIAPQPGSPVVDAGNSSLSLTTDQRGQTRPVDLPNATYPNAGNASDIGAFEAQSTSELVVLQSGPNFEVNVTNDHDGSCTPTDCSLREAIAAANSNTDASEITFKATVFNAAKTITLANDELLIMTSMTITGPTPGVTVDGDGKSRVFIVGGGTVSMDKLTIANGNVDDDDGGGIFNNGGTLTLTNCTLSGNHAENASGGGGIFNGSTLTLTLTNCTIAGNSADGAGDGGGGIYNEGTLTLTNCTLSGNHADGAGYGGGGIFNSYVGAMLIVTNCTLSSNHADNTDYGGGGINNQGPLTLTNSTLAGNHAENASYGGGGILNYYATATVTNCTLAGNSADGSDDGGGAIYNYPDTATVTNCTLAGNHAAGGSGGGIFNDGTINLGNALLANMDGNIANIGTVTSQGYNLSSDDQAALLNQATDQNSTDPLLDTNGLQDNGGPTETIALQSTSPAIDTGNSNLPTDQRGKVRPFDEPTAPNGSGNLSDIGAVEQGSTEVEQSTPFVVNVTNDHNGACTANDCSLREAIRAANGDAVDSAITFDAAVFNVAKTITLGGTELLITTNTTITGPAARVTVDANHLSRVFTINGSGITASISGLTITGGNGAGSVNSGAGGGLFLKSGNLTLLGCTVSNNTASIGLGGGGINNSSTGALTVTNCAITGNTSVGSGGGIVNFNNGTLNISGSTIANNTTNATSSGYGGGIETYNTTTITNSTISGNHADSSSGVSGGGIYSWTTTAITNCTITGNTAKGTNSTGGLRNDHGTKTITVSNTIIAGNSGTGGANADVNSTGTAAFTSGGYNLIGDGTGATGFVNGANGDQVGTTASPIDAKLGTLADNGGPTQTIGLKSSSPAFNAGDPTYSGPLTTDQRGTGFDRVSGGRLDSGALEVQFSLAVTTANDEDDADLSANDISLREAINLANVHANSLNAGGAPDTISFAIPGAGAHTISPTSALPTISEAVRLKGTTQPGYTNYPLVQIDGTNAGAGVDGLTLQSSGSMLSGLALGHFGGAGVRLQGSGGHCLKGCYLGTFYNGPALSNQTAAANATGVLIESSGNLLGLALDNSGAGNRIWTNSGDGVQVNAAAQGNVMRGNSFRDNGDQPIDLNGDGATANDLDANNDADTGANGLQNFPVLTNVALGGNGHTMIQGTLQSKLDQDYRLDFYRATSTAGVSQTSWIGSIYLGNTTVHTSAADGTASFTYDTGGSSTGIYYGVTATDVATGDTSEFSALSFQDGVKPTISITAPNPAGGVLTTGADFPQIQGTATDNLPGVTVRLHLQRVSDGLYWDGTTWGATQTNLPTSVPSGGAGNWHSTGALPKPTPANPVTLRGDKYLIVAYAIDAAGNQSVASKTLSYDLQKPTVSIEAPGTLGQASGVTVNVPDLASGMSGSSANPGVGMQKVQLRLVRNSDNKQWDGSTWVAASPAVYLATSLDDPVGASPAAWSKSSGLPTVTDDPNTGLEVGKVYNLSAVSYDRLNQASNGFLLRVKITASHSVLQTPSSPAVSSQEESTPSE